MPFWTESVQKQQAGYSVKKMFIKISQNLQESTFAGIPIQVLSYNFCEAFHKNSFIFRTPLVVATFITKRT